MNGSRMVNILMKIKRMEFGNRPTPGQNSMRRRKQRNQTENSICQKCQRSRETISRDKDLTVSSSYFSKGRFPQTYFCALKCRPINKYKPPKIRPYHCDYLHSIPKSDTSKFLEIPESWMPLVCVQWSGRGWFLCILGLTDHKTSLTLKVMSTD